MAMMPRSRVSPQVQVDAAGTVCAVSGDGVLTILARRVDNGVCVHRTIRSPGAPRIEQVAVFESQASFRRWCEADALRFDYPLVSRTLLRQADELFNAHATSVVAG